MSRVSYVPGAPSCDMTSPIISSETTPLLQNALVSEADRDADVSWSSPTDGLPEGGNVSRVLGLDHVNFHLFGSLFVDSIPVILSYILQNSIQTASILIVGWLGPEELSVAAFSLMLAFVTG